MALAYWYLVVLTKFEWEVWFITFGCGVKAVVKNAIAIQRSENFHSRHIRVYNSESMSLPVLPARLQVLHR